LGIITISFLLFNLGYSGLPIAVASSINDRLATVDLSETDIPETSILAGNVTSESRPGIVLMDKNAGILSYGKSLFWQAYGLCETKIECSRDSTTGFNDNSSVKISSPLTYEGKCVQDTLPCSFTWIYGSEIPDIKPGAIYNVTTHMKLNEYAIGSHITFQGFNETSKKWINVGQCPRGTNGPLEWKAFSCQVVISENVNKIRPILFNGWSSSPTNSGITWYDDIYIISNGTDDKSNRSSKVGSLMNPLFVQ
jgi:hypothetical protein